MTGDPEEKFDALFSDDHDADFEERQRARGFGTRTGDRWYCWQSPFGVFRVIAKRFESGGIEWRLWIDDKALGSFRDHIDALIAVVNHKTGHKQWDEYDGADQAPADDKDWSEFR